MEYENLFHKQSKSIRFISYVIQMSLKSELKRDSNVGWNRIESNGYPLHLTLFPHLSITIGFAEVRKYAKLSSTDIIEKVQSIEKTGERGFI